MQQHRQPPTPRGTHLVSLRPVFWLTFIRSPRLPGLLAQWHIADFVRFTAAGAAPECSKDCSQRSPDFPFQLLRDCAWRHLFVGRQGNPVGPFRQFAAVDGDSASWSASGLFQVSRTNACEVKREAGGFDKVERVRRCPRNGKRTWVVIATVLQAWEGRPSHCRSTVVASPETGLKPVWQPAVGGARRNRVFPLSALDPLLCCFPSSRSRFSTPRKVHLCPPARCPPAPRSHFRYPNV